MKKVRILYQKALPYLRNQYLVTGFAFFIWMLFFDNNNFISQYSSRHKLKALQADKEYYIKEIADNTESLKELMTNKQTLEKFAREKYLMKKPDEEIFVIVEGDK